MKYVSTRGGMLAQGFSDILLEGLATDGGLAMPESVPQVSATQLESWRGLPYHALAAEVLSLFISDIDAAQLKALTQAAYLPETFQSAEIVPLRPLYDGLSLLGLSLLDISPRVLRNIFPLNGNRCVCVPARPGARLHRT